MTTARKTHTSTAVKQRYIDKTYTEYRCKLRNADFDRIDRLRGEMSRSAFLLMLVDEYEQAHGNTEKH